MKHLKRFILVVVIIAVIIIGINVSPWAPTLSKVSNDWVRQEGKMPLIIPHGGAKEMYPENTMYAFEKTSHYDAFEIDLVLTSDGILITHHDLHLGLMAERSDLFIRDLTYQEVIDTISDAGFPHVRNFDGTVKKEDYSSWTDQEIIDSGLIPVPLEDVFTQYPDKLYILEIKDSMKTTDDAALDQILKETSLNAIAELKRLITNNEMEDKVLVASFDDEVVKNFRELTDDEIATIGGSIDSAILAIMSYFKLDFFHFAKFDALSLPYNEKIDGGLLSLLEKFPGFIKNILTIQVGETYYFNMKRAELQKDAQRKNIAVIYWTVNNKDDMIELVKRGADGIITDNPELLEEVIKMFK